MSQIRNKLNLKISLAFHEDLLLAMTNTKKAGHIAKVIHVLWLVYFREKAIP